MMLLLFLDKSKIVLFASEQTKIQKRLREAPECPRVLPEAQGGS